LAIPFAVNTGCHDGEICNLRWDWEVQVPEMDTSIFIVPEHFVKNGEERLVVLNKIAKSVVNNRRGPSLRANYNALLCG
jgi:integrase